jgi:arylsulfotransferase ASST
MEIPERSFETLAARVLGAASVVAALAGCGGSPVGSTVPAILFSPIASTSAFLMTLDGQELHEWKTDYAPGYSVYLLPNGNLLRATSIPERPFSTAQGSNGGSAEMLDWNSNVVWRFDYATTAGQQHHDVFWMPDSGHVLMVAWERRTAAEAIAAGRDAQTLPSEGELWVDKVVEVDPTTSQVVWEWRTWDHLLPPGAAASDHPELVDPRFAATPSVDWTHANAVFYNAALNQVLLSVRNFSEFWIIDHSTTTAEAAGHSGGKLGRGGDLVYRYGNPRAYGLDVPQQLYGQHNAQWIASGLPGAGHFLVFNNGDAKARPYSTVVELVPPVRDDGSYVYDPATGYGPAEPVWQYTATPPESFFAPIISGAQRLASGNTLVTSGPTGHFFEVTSDGQTVWSYDVTDTAGTTGFQVFRAVRYEPGFEGLSQNLLAPEGPLRIPVLTAGARPTLQSY